MKGQQPHEYEAFELATIQSKSGVLLAITEIPTWLRAASRAELLRETRSSHHNSKLARADAFSIFIDVGFQYTVH